jgi:plasmid stability protein
MNNQVGENDVLIEDIRPDLLRRIEVSARANRRSVEEEAKVLLERGLASYESESS